MPTSKMTLKLSCLSACDNDIDRAEKLYQFLVGDLGELPDVDPVSPSGFQQVKESVSEVFGWINEHREDIEKGVQLIQSFRGNTKPATNPLNIDPIPMPTE